MYSAIILRIAFYHYIFFLTTLKVSVMNDRI